jgi:hypothetical protein
MTNEHPITPPPELVAKLWREASAGRDDAPIGEIFNHGVYLAYAAGADQELRACCDTLQRHAHWDLAVFELMDDRRPKPPSLKELALKALQFVDEKLDLPLHNHCNAIHTIRRALEALDD